MDRHKSAIVTGGASGFGAAISTSLAEHGIDVLIADLDFDGSSAVASGINQARCRAMLCRSVATSLDLIRSQRWWKPHSVSSDA